MISNPNPVSPVIKDLEQFRPLVEFQARKYVRYGLSLEDLVQEGFIGLLEAAARFDPSRYAGFETYAVFWVKKYILQAVDSEFRHNRLVTEEKASSKITASPLKISESTPSMNLPDAMPALEKQILQLSYAENLTINEIGTRLELTPEKVRRIRSKALRRLRS